MFTHYFLSFVLVLYCILRSQQASPQNLAMPVGYATPTPPTMNTRQYYSVMSDVDDDISLVGAGEEMPAAMNASDKNPMKPDKNPMMPDKNPMKPDKNPMMPDKNPMMPNSNGSMPDMKPMMPNSNASKPGGVMPGAGGVMPGAGGVMPGAGGVMPAAGGVMPGAGGVMPGAGGVMPGAGGVMPGGGAQNNVDEMINAMNGSPTGTNPMMPMNGSMNQCPNMPGTPAMPNMNGMPPNMNGMPPTTPMKSTPPDNCPKAMKMMKMMKKVQKICMKMYKKC